jgi:hypothetical protein
MSCDRYARMIIKTGAGVPTIPASADHRNGDWIDTDIYEGEQYMDTDTGLIYTRNASDIIVVGSTAGYKVYRANLTQTGTSAPTETILENTLSGRPTFAYVGPGDYTITLTGEWTASKTFILINNYPEGGIVRIQRTNSNEISLETFNTSFVSTNSVLQDTSIEIKVYE